MSPMIMMGFDSTGTQTHPPTHPHPHTQTCTCTHTDTHTQGCTVVIAGCCVFWGHHDMACLKALGSSGASAQPCNFCCLWPGEPLTPCTPQPSKRRQAAPPPPPQGAWMKTSLPEHCSHRGMGEPALNTHKARGTVRLGPDSAIGAGKVTQSADSHASTNVASALTSHMGLPR